MYCCDHIYMYMCVYVHIYVKYYCCCFAKLCPTLCDPRDCSSPGSSVYGVSQSRILEWVAISYARGSSDSGIKTISLASPAVAVGFFTISTTWKAQYWAPLVAQLVKNLPGMQKTLAGSLGWKEPMEKG